MEEYSPMMIKEVRINGFRGIREGYINGLDQVTILIGRNGSGKSSILEALYLASSCANPRDEVREVGKLDCIVKRRGGRGSWNGSRRLLWYMGSIEKPIEINIHAGDKALEFVVANASKEKRPVRLHPKGGYFIDLDTGYVLRNMEHVAGRASDEIISISGELARMRDFLKGFLLVDGALIRRPEVVEKYAWSRLLAKRLDKHIVKMIKEEFEAEAEGLTYAPSDEGYYYLALQTSETAVRIDDLGNGARSALLGAMLVLAYKPTVLLVEEPELHMHPAGLHTYMKLLLKLSKEEGFQIITSTHSMEVIQILRRIAEKLGLNLAVLYLERKKGVLKARNFTMEDIDALQKLGVDPRLLYKF